MPRGGGSAGSGHEVKTTIAASAVAAALLCAVGAFACARPGHAERRHRRQRPRRARARIAFSSTPRKSSTTTIKNTVSATGDVQLNYQGRTLQADRVTYDRNTGRVHAEGNARLTEANGSVITGDQFELTDDFKSGFIDSLRVVQTSVERGRPSHPFLGSAGRADRGRDHGFRARHLYGLRTLQGAPGTASVLAGQGSSHHSQQQRAHDLLRECHARVRRHSGRLPAVFLVARSDRQAQDRLPGAPLRGLEHARDRRIVAVLLGHRAQLRSDADAGLFEPPGLLGQAEWRHRLVTGSYNIRASGIVQQDPEAFLPSPSGAGDRTSVARSKSAGLFYINERWKWGWDVALLSDKYFLQNYRIRSESLPS